MNFTSLRCIQFHHNWHISTNVYSQVLIYTAEWTGASWMKRRCPRLKMAAKWIESWKFYHWVSTLSEARLLSFSLLFLFPSLMFVRYKNLVFSIETCEDHINLMTVLCVCQETTIEGPHSSPDQPQGNISNQGISPHTLFGNQIIQIQASIGILIHSNLCQFIHWVLRPLLWVANVPCKRPVSAALFICLYRLEPVQSLRSSTHVRLGLPLPLLPFSLCQL